MWRVLGVFMLACAVGVVVAAAGGVEWGTAAGGMAARRTVWFALLATVLAWVLGVFDER